MNDAVRLLLSRRSVPPVALQEPGPSEHELQTILTAASRVPDHGKLAPWRFVVLKGAHRATFAERLVQVAVQAGESDQQRLANEKRKYEAPLVIVVVSRAAPHVKIPEWEQVLSAGAVCMNLLLAAHALGYAASWLTGKPSYDGSAASVLGLHPGEQIAGFIHVGTPTEMPSDRPRPALDDITSTWVGG
jgi:nitroreductase